MSECNGRFVSYKDMGDYTQVKYRCPYDNTYVDVKIGMKFCPNCGGRLSAEVEILEPESRLVTQVKIDGEWETVE